MISMTICLLRTRIGGRLRGGGLRVCLGRHAGPGGTSAEPAAAPPEAAAIKKALEMKFPGSSRRRDHQEPVFRPVRGPVRQPDDLHRRQGQVRAGRRVYDADSKANLTEADAQAQSRRHREPAARPGVQARQGQGRAQLIVFSDADCPFCAKLESELKAVDNVTIYTFLFPIDQLHPDSARKSQDDLVRGGQGEGMG